MRWARAIGAAGRSWSWWLAAALLEFALALPAAVLWHDWLAGALGGRYEPAELFANLSTSFRFDQRARLSELGGATGAWLSLGALLAMLLGIFLAGGWAALSFDGGTGAVLARGGAGARRFFGRYLRVWLLTLVLLALWTWMLFDAPWRCVVHEWILRLPAGEGDRLENLVSEWSVVLVRGTQAVLYALGVALVLCCADYARLRVAWRDARCVGWEYLAALAMVVRRPWRTLAPLGALFASEVLLVAGASVLARAIEGRLGRNQAGLESVFALAGFTLCVLLLRCWLRGARYQAAAEIVASDVAPLSRPFLWRAGARAGAG